MPNGDGPSSIDSGTVGHFFDESPDGDWSQYYETRAWAQDGNTSDKYGISVSLSRSILAVGASEDTNAIGIEAGSVYLAAVPTFIFEDGFESGDTSGWSSAAP